MPIIISCPSCNRKLKAKDEQTGRRMRCPVCMTIITVSAISNTQNSNAKNPETPAINQKECLPLSRNIVTNSIMDSARSENQEERLSKNEVGQFLFARALRIEHLLRGSKEIGIIDIRYMTRDDIPGDGYYRLLPALKCNTNNGDFYVAMSGHLARLTSRPYDAFNIVYWIEDDIPDFLAQVSNNNDIIAYQNGTSHNMISKVIEICNSI